MLPSPSASSLAPGTLVPRLIHEPVFFQPRHHVAQLLADYLDRMLAADPAQRVELGGAGLILEQEFLRVGAGLDLLEDAAHLVLAFLGDDARTAREVAVLGVVRDRVAH